VKYVDLLSLPIVKTPGNCPAYPILLFINQAVLVSVDVTLELELDSQHASSVWTN